LLGVEEARARPAPKAEPAPAPVAAPVAAPRRKLSYKEQRALEALPGQIEALEEELAALQQETAEPSFYQRPVEETRAALARLESLQHEVDAVLERWAELED